MDTIEPRNIKKLGKAERSTTIFKPQPKTMNSILSTITLIVILAHAFHTTQATFEENIPREETSGDKAWVFGVRYHVHIINGLSDKSRPLVVHCKSKDDDLGSHELQVGEEVTWNFKVRIDGSTLFACDVEWDKKSKHFSAFDAFNGNKDGNQKCYDTGNCYWLVTEDEFYLSNDNFTWLPQFGW